MSPLRTFGLATLLIGLAGTAGAQMPAASGQPAPMPGISDPGTMPPVMDNRIFVHALLDQFEGRVAGQNPGFRWDGQAWAGTDYDKLWVKSEGIANSAGRVEDGRDEFLYDRAVSTYFDLQGGLRTDLDSRRTRNWGAFGVQGLAPLFFNLEATAYVSDAGHFAGRVEASYDLLITQRLILQPEVEFNLYTRSDPARLVGAGFSDIDTGLRLRYELSRKIAPYLGVVYEGKFGQTANFARQAGQSAGDIRFVFGIRTWF